MQKLFFTQLILMLVVACQTSQAPSITPTSQTVNNGQHITTPTSAVTAGPTAAPTQTLFPAQTPSSVPSSTPLPNPFELDVVGELIAYPLPIIREGDTAVYVQESRLIVANVADPALPIVIWKSEFLGNVIDSTADKDFIYVWLDGEILILNIKDLQQPTQIARMPFDIVQEGFRKEITVDADKLYLVQVIREDALLTVIDVAIRESPQLLGTSEYYFPAFHRYLISDGLLFVIDDGQIDVYDISDPLQVNRVEQIIVPTNINSSLLLQEDRLFVATHSKLIVLDISNLSSPTQVAEYINWQINQLALFSQTALLYSEICGWESKDDGTISGGCSYLMDVVDISNPLELASKEHVRLRFPDNQDFMQQMNLLGSFLYCELSDGSLYVIAINQFGE